LKEPGISRFVAAVVAVAVLGACSGSDSSTTDGRPRNQNERIPAGAHFTPPPLESVTEQPQGWFESACELPLEQVQRIRRGYFPGRSPDVLIVPREPNYFGGFFSMSHSGPWDYLQRVPLVFYGPGFIRPIGEFDPGRPATVADLAPTLARLLEFEWPRDRAGRALTEVLVPRKRRPGRPAAVVVVAWDGGGWNVLDTWPEAWPNLARFIQRGASPVNATVGSSPSVTPAVHTTMGTGTFPDQHGITAIYERIGDQIVGSYPDKSARHLEISSLADDFDRATGNAARIGLVAYRPWHLGMIGRGAMAPGGDKDIAVLVDLQERLTTNTDFYSVPEYLQDTPGLGRALRQIDLLDGKQDDTWMEHEILATPRERRDTPAWILYQTKLIETILEREGFGADEVPDLFFTNYKQIDEAGHNWNMLSKEMEVMVRYSDDALRDLERWLNQNVGRRRWVMVVSADHGQGPDPLAARAWPIRILPLTNDLAAHFDLEPDELIQESSITGYWMRRDVMEAKDITAGDVANFFINYRLEDNVPAGEKLRAQYESRKRELLFSAAFPGTRMERVWRCALEEGRE
jgi:hypothetical protein